MGQGAAAAARTRHAPGNDRAKAFVVVGVIVLAVAAFGWTQLGGGGTGNVPGDSHTPVPTVTVEPTPTDAEPTPTDAPTPVVAQVGDPVDIADGRYFVTISAMDAGDPPTAAFDLMYFYEGAEARQQAAADSTTTVPGRFGDIYVVNDNPKMRTFAVSPDATVTYYEEYPSDRTTTLTPVKGKLSELIAGMNCQAATPVGINPMNFDWWITLDHGQIVSIEEAMDVIGDPAPDGPCSATG